MLHWRRVAPLPERESLATGSIPVARLLFFTSLTIPLVAVAVYMPFVPNLSERAALREQMDDFSIADERLARALRELRHVNSYLGGWRALQRELAPAVRRREGGSLTVLDIGTGLADLPERLVRWGADRGVALTVTAIDANPATVAFAEESLDQRLNGRLRERIDLRVAGVFNFEPPHDGGFDVVVASSLLHHFYADDAVRVLRVMDRMAAMGLIVNDLHRHLLAYSAIQGIARLLPVSEMFRHDGPASVRRGFTPRELCDLAEKAGLQRYRVRRYWAYRLILSTLPQ